MNIMKQFKEVIEYSKVCDGCIGLNISDKSASVIGLSKNPVLTKSAIAFLKFNNQFYVKGWMDGSYYESSTIDGLDAFKPISIGIDCRKPNNTKIYYQADRSLGVFNSHTGMTEKDSAIIFFEDETQACLTIGAYDPLREEVIREVVSAPNESLKKFLRAVIFRDLNAQIISFDQPSIHENEDGLEEEVHTHDTECSESIFQR